MYNDAILNFKALLFVLGEKCLSNNTITDLKNTIKSKSTQKTIYSK